MKNFGKCTLSLLTFALVSTVPALADMVSYTCDPTIDATQAGTCAYLNSTVSGLYGSTFSNANASIYIKQGTTGLGESTPGFFNSISYNTYLSDLSANALASGNAVQASAVASLTSLDNGVYGGGSVVITSALGLALGVSPSSLIGTTADGASCTVGTAGCYNGIITVTTPANLSSESGGTQGLYWNQTGGTQPADDYDFYSVVEHETDEILGTASCISTGGSLTDPCNFLGTGTPSAVDLFRFAGLGALIPDSSLSTTPGAYFSYDGGATNGADGAVYNTLANGRDYADFATNCQHVQDAQGCTGLDLEITNDGNAEINILNAVGYELNSTAAATPEPGTFAMLGFGFVAFGAIAYRRRGALLQDRLPCAPAPLKR